MVMIMGDEKIKALLRGVQHRIGRRTSTQESAESTVKHAGGVQGSTARPWASLSDNHQRLSCRESVVSYLRLAERLKS